MDIIITAELARKLIIAQFPEYAHLPVSDVEQQGHDNRTYRLGRDMLIRMPTDEPYALKVSQEQALLPQLARHLRVSIPAPIKMGMPSNDYPYPFSIYRWLEGKSVNLLHLNNAEMTQLSHDLAVFLQALQAIAEVAGPAPGQHNFWRGDHVRVYDQGAREQIATLADVIESNKAIDVWQRACATEWNKPPVWVHGDFAVGNILMYQGKLSAVIDFGCTAMGDPACDLAIAWTYFVGKARDTFIREMNAEDDVWLRARAWALWKASFTLCQMADKDSHAARQQKSIIDMLIN